MVFLWQLYTLITLTKLQNCSKKTKKKTVGYLTPFVGEANETKYEKHVNSFTHANQAVRLFFTKI